MADIGDISPEFVDIVQPRRYGVQELKEAAVQYADHYGVPRDLMLGYFGAESNWNPVAKNPKSSATGLGQIIDATGRGLGLNITGGPDDDRLDPAKNMDAIGREMARLYEVHGDWKKVLMSIGEPHEGYYNIVKNRAQQEMNLGLGERLPEIREQQPVSLLETVKDYLGIKDTPAFLPVFDRDQGMWRAQERYQALKHFHSWEEPTELERVFSMGLNAITFGVPGAIYKQETGRDYPMPETIPGALAGAGLSFGGFMYSPFPLAQNIIGTRLNPTRSGIRGMAQLMAEGGATLGLAASLSSLIPALAGNEELSERGYNFIKGAASSAMVGVLFPVIGANTGKPVSTALRTAAGMAVMDFLRTRFHEAPDKGWFTFDDVIRGLKDGSIDKTVLANKAFDYLLDLYFVGKTPTMTKSLGTLKLNELKRNAALAEAFKTNPREAEDAIMEIGKSKILTDPAAYKVAELRALDPSITDSAAQLIIQDPELFRQFTAQHRVAGDRERQLAQVREEFPGISDGAANFVLEERGFGTGKERPPPLAPMDRDTFGKNYLKEHPNAGPDEVEWAWWKRTPEERAKLYPVVSPEAPQAKEGGEGERGGSGEAGTGGTGEAAPAEPRWKQGYELSAEEYVSRYRALRESEGTGRGGEGATGGKEKTEAEILALREQDVIRAMKAGEPVPEHIQAEFAEHAEKWGKELPSSPDLSIENVPVSQIKVDPKTFQFKLMADEATGAGLALGDVQKWNEAASGVLTLWRSPEGELYVVNGHQRLAAAKRLGQETVRAQILDSATFTKEHARATGALINMAETRGTELDMAKFMKDQGYDLKKLAESGISMSEAKTRRALALTQVSDGIFEQTALGRFPLDKAVVLGEELPGNHPAQEAIYRQMEKLEGQGRMTAEKFRELVKLAKGAGVTTQEQMTLFGKAELQKSLILEKADLLEHGKRNLREDKALFGQAAKKKGKLDTAGETIIDKDTSQIISKEAGELLYFLEKTAYDPDSATGKLLNDFAAQLAAKGAKKSEVRNEFYQKLKETLRGDARGILGVLPGHDAADVQGRAARGGPGVEGNEGAPPGGKGRDVQAAEVKRPGLKDILADESGSGPDLFTVFSDLRKAYQERLKTYPLTAEPPKVEDTQAGKPVLPDLQENLDQVKRAVPGIAEAQARLLAEDPALFTKVMQGNLSMEEARQLAEGRAHAAQEPQRALEGLEAPDSLFGYALKDPKNLYGGGPDVEYVKQYANKLTEFGGKMIDWADKHLERSLPPELKDKDASKNIGVLLMKIQQFEDISRTYPEAKPIFDAARAGLALKMRLSVEFYGFMVHYLQKLNPGERANVDKLLVDRDIINDLTWGLDFRLQDIDKFRSYLTNPWPEIREKGVAWYMREGLSRNEAEGAFGFRMAFDYAKALKMDYHTRAFQEWLAAHGIDPGKSKDILDMILHSEYKPEHIAESYFGPEPGKNIKTILENFRLNMQYWLKETNEYIPRTRYGDYFIRVFDRAVDTPLKVAARKFADAAEKHFGDLDPKEAEWLDAKGQSGVPKALKGVYQELRAAIKFADEHAERPKDGAALMTEALRLLNPVVHATAAASPAEYHRKVAELNEQFADPRYQVSAKLEKRLPMEMFVEANIPATWRIIRDAADKVGEHNLKIKEAALSDAHDFFATAKGSFGEHFVKRADVLIPGYETDLMRPATDYLGGLAGYLGKWEKIRGFSEAYKEFPRDMPNLFKHMNDYTNYVLSNPYEFQGIRNLIYHWTLGGNLSFYLLNSLQNIHMGWAALGKVSKSPLKEIGGAYKDWVKYMTKGEGLREGEEAALIKARYEPELAPSAASDLSGRANNPLYRWLHNDPTSIASKGIDVVKSLWYGTGIETLNRETFFLAAFRATGDFDQSLALIRDAHLLYGKETRPEWFRGAGAVPGVFMTFSLGYFTMLKNFGKAAVGVHPETYGTKAAGAAGLARMTAGAMITGGLMGTFLWPILKTAYHKIFDSDLELDGKKWLDEQLHDSPVSGEMAHRLLFRGPLAGALGVDISARVAPNVPFMNMPPGPAKWQDLVGAVLGAGSIPLQRGFQVGAALSEGQTGRALEAAVPVSMAAPMAAYRLRTEGATTLSGRPIFTADGEPLKLTGWETAAKAVAFQPVRLAEHHKTERFARDREQDKKNQTQKYSGRLARAVRESDDKAFNDVIGEWTAYNNKMIAKGRLADVITPESVEAGVMSRFKPKFPDVSEKQMLLRQLSE